MISPFKGLILFSKPVPPIDEPDARYQAHVHRSVEVEVGEDVTVDEVRAMLSMFEPEMATYVYIVYN